ncbi:hypothetical protein C0Q70_01520 [Pomacea canaliculata]|uniref:Uncharacterized protein n=1 Tax=Pomacea canaliculata TaxID=400727 RepID=A0A2T7PZP2_POMCA|nr:hypothetical protein C0Q70_01520 [Pomacea canaliculata]
METESQERCALKALDYSVCILPGSLRPEIACTNPGEPEAIHDDWEHRRDKATTPLYYTCVCATFIPSTSDIIHVYASTCGVCDHDVTIGGTTFQLTEMGGRSLTSLKLLRFFDNVSSIVFMASCADVERSLRHGALTSGFEETRLFFQTIARDPFLVKLPIILLFTKLDLLVAKSNKFDLKSVFPDFIGNTHDVEDVKNYVFTTFKEKCGARRIYHHFLLGTDSHKVQSVFADVRRDIRDNLLRKVIPE